MKSVQRSKWPRGFGLRQSSGAFTLVELLVAIAFIFVLMTERATCAPLKIACVGDSITAGLGLSNPALESYPARLQWLLGANFVVRNYGVPATTVLKQGDFPYWNTTAYTESRNWAPDIVIVKLGTNDSWEENWRYGTNFVPNLEEFIASYQALTSHPRVILCTPAPVFNAGAYGIYPGAVATNIVPAVRVVASGLGLEIVDYHTRLAGHTEWFPDTIHPNTRGAAVMAAIAHDTIQNIATPPPAISLQVLSGGSNRAVVTWLAEGAGMVLQTTTQLSAAIGWTVADSIPYSDGTFVRVTNTIGTTRFFRLWRP